MTQSVENRKPSRKDFASNQTVRWCPGCGDYAILAQMQSVMAELGVKKEEVVFVSGIGCSSRFPYYMDTYGFHSIHGRAPAVATGVKLANPNLQVWVVTGDGDALSIGGNHIIHAMRRNVDFKILLFNNQIYGLTKGQFSPTSKPDLRTKSSPGGTLTQPLNPLSIAIASEATFVARTLDSDPKHMQETFHAAARHKGTAFVEILQNCPIFNDGAFSEVSDKAARPNNAVYLETGRPLRFGIALEHGIAMDGVSPIVRRGTATDEGLIVHDPTRGDLTYAMMLSRFVNPDFPIPVGVLRKVERPTFDEAARGHVAAARAANKKTLQDLINGSNTWTI